MVDKIGVWRYSKRVSKTTGHPMIVCKWSEREWFIKSCPGSRRYRSVILPSPESKEIERLIKNETLQLALIGYKIPDFSPVEIFVNNTDGVTVTEARRWAVALGLVEQDFYL